MNPLAKTTLTTLKKSMSEEQWERFSQLMWGKYHYALETWAIAKMGADTTKFYELAWELFLTNLAVSGILDAIESDTLFSLIETTPQLIPQNVKDRMDLPLLQYDPSEVQDEYKKIEKIVAEARKKTKKKRLRYPRVSRGPQVQKAWKIEKARVDSENETAYYMALKERLPGYPEERIKRAVSNEWKPSQIALDYIAQRYKFPFHGETLKQRLALTKDPDRLKKKIEKDLFKSLNLALSIGK